MSVAARLDAMRAATAFDGCTTGPRSDSGFSHSVGGAGGL
jgi:hypothetical protein